VDLDIVECSDLEPVSPEVRKQIVEPFISAANLTLAEMAQTEPFVRSVFRTARLRSQSDITAVLGLAGQEGSGDVLVLSFPAETAKALAARVLVEVTPAPDDELIRDCMGELANVIAGQAKTLLAESPYQLLLGTPKVLLGPGLEVASPASALTLVVVFGTDAGDFVLQVCLDQDAARAAPPASALEFPR
jgi:chemotaxis protein CheX